MTQVIVPPSNQQNEERLLLDVHLYAEVLGPERVRRKANVWLLDNVGHLLRAEDPEIVIGEQLTWRVTVALTSPEKGRVGSIGHLHLDAKTGEVHVDEGMLRKFLANADTLIGR